MTERKLTDEEVIKALECCASLNGCAECPYRDKEYKSSTDNCGYNSTKDALDLINRKNAEIESLKKTLHELKMEAEMVYKQRDVLKKQVDTQKGEIERLEELVDKLKSHSFKAIDKPVKEMTEESNG